MSGQAIIDWVGYSQEAIALLDELDSDFRVGNMDRPSIDGLMERLHSSLEQVERLETQLGMAKGLRDSVNDEVQDFAVKLRAAVVARYGARSTQAARVPKAYRRSRSSTPQSPPSGQ